MLKSILKIITGLLIGVAIGLVIAAVIIVFMTDTTFPEFLNKILSVGFGEALLAAGVGILSFLLSVFILVTLHEAGHLVCGLMSGYKFVSFRIFNLTFIKLNGKICIKKYSISGTGGQCLLAPPDLSLEQIPTAWYNIGGVLANIISVIIVLPLLWFSGNPFIIEFASIFILTGIFLILINGIPMKVSGAGNDAFNIIALRKNLMSKRGLVDSLRANALIQNGIRPKDMPVEWFVIPSGIDYKNQLEVSIPLMAASRLIDEMRYVEALKEFEHLYEHKSDIIDLYVKEIECELVFLRLVCGNIQEAEELLDDDLNKYIESYRKTMSSKQRILCAISLILNNNREKALEIYDSLVEKADEYLLQGEVKSDLAIMKSILNL